MPIEREISKYPNTKDGSQDRALSFLQSWGWLVALPAALQSWLAGRRIQLCFQIQRPWADRKREERGGGERGLV